jgi:hypothetical protein
VKRAGRHPIEVPSEALEALEPRSYGPLAQRGQVSVLVLACCAGLAIGCEGPGLEPPGTAPAAQGGRGGDGTSGGGGLSGAAGTRESDAGAPPVDAPSFDGGARDGAADSEDGAVDGSIGEGDAATGSTHASRELVGPSYMGSVDNGTECSTSYPTRGHEPVSSQQRHPLFLYFVGTAFVATDPSANHDSLAALTVTEAMARRGFVALSVQYDNGALAWLSDHVNQLACLFDGARPASLITTACALPNVDCDLGIAAWGHSQGGYVAATAYNLEPRIGAVWATGYGDSADATLPRDRLRVVNGEADLTNGMASTLNRVTDLTTDECPMPDRCLRTDGSGWIIVRASELAMPDTSTADHCWFDRPSCSATSVVLEPNWVDPLSDKAFALESNADWVAIRARR